MHQPTLRLAHKVAIITGAGCVGPGWGNGRATAVRFAQEGAKVFAVDIDLDAMADTQKMIAEFGGDFTPYVADVTQAESVQSMVQACLDRYGKIDILVNNAGITQDARLQKMTIEQFDRVIDVNLRGVFHFSQAVADAMVKQGSGVILNASSVVGIYGNFGQTNYVASKSGVIGFTKTWARELGPKGIRVNAVAPGFIDTPMIKTIPEKVLEAMQSQIPLRRMGTAEEIANAYAFLASDEASYINGVVLEVTGGATV